MDIEKQPISVFIREAVLKTPQGWVLAASFIINWLIVLLVSVTSSSIFVPESGVTSIYLLFLPWPFVVLTIFVKASSPHYNSSIWATFLTLWIAGVPYWCVYV